jgi:hypothetical protein
MARRDQAIVKRYAVFVKQRRDGHDYFIRRPYDSVEYNWGDGDVKTYLQLRIGSGFSRSVNEEGYDDVRIYSTPPAWDIINHGL